MFSVRFVSNFPGVSIFPSSSAPVTATEAAAAAAAAASRFVFADLINSFNSSSCERLCLVATARMQAAARSTSLDTREHSSRLCKMFYS